MPISQEEFDRIMTTNGTRQDTLRTVRNNIIAMKEGFGVDEGDMLACVKDAYQEPTA